MEQNIITVLNDNKSLFTRKVIQNADAKLAILVPETHNAILVKDGQMLQTLSSGKYTLEKFVDLKNDTNSTLEVLFMSKTAKLKLLWGTPSKFLVYDDKLQENYHIGLSGSFEVQIADCRRCYLYLVGVAESLMADDLQNIVCSGCGTALDSEAKFCYNCGRKVGGAKVCPNCQTENNDEAKFCYNCGEKL